MMKANCVYFLQHSSMMKARTHMKEFHVKVEENKKMRKCVAA